MIDHHGNLNHIWKLYSFELLPNKGGNT